MLKSIQQRDLDRNRWIKISMTVILVLICAAMVITLIPGLTGGLSSGPRPDTVATVGSEDINIMDVRRQITQMTRGQNVPEMLRAFYAQQALDGLIFEHALEVEADRLGIQVTPEEETERIKLILPEAWSGGVWQKDLYAREVQVRAGMAVPEFETVVRNSMLQEKFERLVTDGITVTPAEIAQEFRRRNEKVKIDYALVKPTDLVSSIHPTDAELAAYFAKNSLKYQIPEKRSARYALLDFAKLRAKTQVSDEALHAYYNEHIDQFQVENRAHVEHILFKTIGKTDAEVAEIRQKAEDVLKKAKHGGNFEDLAKKYSEDDATKVKGGDLGWIVEGQTVPEFQRAAFTLPKGSISDLVKTQYGFHIIRVMDRETAHTKSLDEVRATILPILLDEKVTADANDISNQMAAAVRQSNRQPMEALAKKFELELGDAPPASISDPVGELGNSADVHQVLFELHPGELSQPLRVENGYAILTVKQLFPAHQGKLDEVHDRVLADYQQEKSLELAHARAEELAKRAQGGEAFDKVAKGLGIEVKNSEPFAETGSIPDVASGKQLRAAFSQAVGQVSSATQAGTGWLVYRVVSHEAANPDDLANQPELKQGIETALLQAKRSAALEAFRTALEDRLKKEGKLTINAEAVKRLTHSS
jgi:peptidyl-prolyl cis-trans isomerase D